MNERSEGSASGEGPMRRPLLRVVLVAVATAFLLAPAAALASHQSTHAQDRGEAIGTIALVLLVSVGVVA